MKKILIIDGHPSQKSFCCGLADSYEKSARDRGFDVQRMNIRELKFNINLMEGYNEIQDLEPDLVKSQELVKWCEHLVLVYPIWWLSMPAILKGYFDRSWLPTFAFKYHKDDPFWDRLLKGRSARLVATSDAPTIYNWLVYFGAPYHSVKKGIFKFCGFSPVKLTTIGGVKNLKEAQRSKLLEKLSELGAKGG